MPPPGGFPNVKYARAVPKSRGPSGPVLYAAGLFAVMYGFYTVGQTNIANRKYKIEKRNARIALMPLLQAEEDASYVIARKKATAKEAAAMIHVPGKNARTPFCPCSYFCTLAPFRCARLGGWCQCLQQWQVDGTYCKWPPVGFQELVVVDWSRPRSDDPHCTQCATFAPPKPKTGSSALEPAWPAHTYISTPKGHTNRSRAPSITPPPPREDLPVAPPIERRLPHLFQENKNATSG
jgi:NADH dehydrogenase (ubiquinone) 1 alpha subcomplex subunit 13